MVDGVGEEEASMVALASDAPEPSPLGGGPRRSTEEADEEASEEVVVSHELDVDAAPFRKVCKSALGEPEPPGDGSCYTAELMKLDVLAAPAQKVSPRGACVLAGSRGASTTRDLQFWASFGLCLAWGFVSSSLLGSRLQIRLAVSSFRFLFLGFAMYTSGVEFGSPELAPRGLCGLILGLCLSSAATALMLLPFRLDLPAHPLELISFACGATIVLVSAMFLRGTALLSVLCWPFVVAITSLCKGKYAFALTVAEAFVPVAACAFTRYRCDQRIVFSMLITGSYSTRFVSLPNSWGPCALLLYVFALMRRSRRRLPPGLGGARFVRLGYLRKMLASGEQIRRCQELPDEAFGDPGRAMELVVVSHRWLDQRTSDVCTPQFPQGVKLASLTRRLERHLGLSGCSRSALTVGGWDVLVFFDFMSLPQPGMDEAGAPIPRTASEQAVFDRCLPLMGTLYSMFPVLVLEEVPQDLGFYGYHESGWCTCEFFIASLGRQLQPFSTDVSAPDERRFIIESGAGNMDGSGAQAFLDMSHSCMEKAKFNEESDRVVVQSILRRFVAKRVLADSVRSGDLQLVRDLLAQLSDEDLRSILEEPVDAKLDTLLHAAVRAGELHVCRELLKNGARANARNINGDTPSQWYILPRPGRAAAACRGCVNPGVRDVKADTGALSAHETPADAQKSTTSIFIL